MNDDDFDFNVDLPWGFTVGSAILLTASLVGILYLAFGTGRISF